MPIFDKPKGFAAKFLSKKESLFKQSDPFGNSEEYKKKKKQKELEEKWRKEREEYQEYVAGHGGGNYDEVD